MQENQCKAEIIADDYVWKILSNKKELLRIICSITKKLREKLGYDTNLYLEAFVNSSGNIDFSLVCETQVSEKDYDKLQDELKKNWFRYLRRKIKNYNLSINIEAY